MTPEGVVARARSVIGRGCQYGLGTGGYHAEDPVPWGAHRTACDCSGFASWALGVSRMVGPKHPWRGLFPHEWVETTNVHRDATGTRGAFSGVPWQDARPGDLLVWPDGRRDDGTRRQGHVGVVASIGPEGPETVVHCAASNKPDAIQETGSEMFRARGAIVARCLLLDPPGVGA